MGVHVGLDQDIVVQHKQSEFEAIEYSGLVEDSAQRILNSLLGAAYMECDLAILAAVHDEGNDSKLELRKTLTYAQTDRFLTKWIWLVANQAQNPSPTRQMADAAHHS